MEQNINEALVLESFKKMVSAEKDLVSCMEDAFLLKFLRTWKYNCDKALKLLINYYKLSLENPEMYKHFSPRSPPMQRIFEQNCGIVLPERDHLGRRVLLTKTGNWDPTQSSFNDLFLSLHLSLEVMIEEVETQFNGIVLITDVQGIGFAHARELGPSNFRKMLHLVEQSFPAWFHAFHFVNVNPVFKMVFALIYPILSKDLRQKVFLHSNFQELHKHFDPKILPANFDGNEEIPFDNSEGVQKLLEHEEVISKFCKFGYKSVIEQAE